MGEASSIEWCHHTFNPWWGCTRVSPGCENCYAETWAKRYGTQWGPKAERRFLSAAHWKQPIKWNRKAAERGVRDRVFCASMADVFEDQPELLLPRAMLWKTIEATPHLDWLILTKRPENIARLGYPEVLARCWLGVSVEDQKAADERIPLLLDTPAAVRFLSCEPLLGAVNLRPKIGPFCGCPQGSVPSPCDNYSDTGRCRSAPRTLEWVIVGGESGPGARPCDVQWIRSIVDQCKAAGVPAFVKQLGAKPIDSSWVTCSGPRLGEPMRVKLASRKGGDPREWPEDLRVREFPESPAG